jgi:meso-butanediol dehydrogenase/(S,S)-butanediol dehydrogenase/diacetyl reductase
MGVLDDTVAIVTGGSSGIGEAITRRFAGEGATVAFCGRDRARGESLEAELREAGGRVDFDVCDVGSAEAAAWVNGVAERHGRIDIVVNNAGIAFAGPVETLALADWEAMLRVNVTGMLLVSQAAIPHLRAAGGGSIINLGSTASYIGLRGAVGYAVTKSAALGLAKGMALELAPDGIRVNALCPGTTMTPAHTKWLSDQPDAEAVHEALVAGHPIGRVSTAEEQANAALFLASSQASFITGHGLLVDGGYTAQ